MITPNDPKLVQARDRILKKALTDAGFKKALLADANSAIEKELGAKLPAGVKIKVVEDTASVVHLVLPAAPTVKNSQLSEADLEKVSGGGSGLQQHPDGYHPEARVLVQQHEPADRTLLK